MTWSIITVTVFRASWAGRRGDLLVSRGIIDPAEWGVSVMAGFGYRAEEIHPKRRRGYDEVVQVID